MRKNVRSAGPESRRRTAGSARWSARTPGSAGSTRRACHSIYGDHSPSMDDIQVRVGWHDVRSATGMRLFYVIATALAGTALIATPLMRPHAQSPEDASLARAEEPAAAAAEAPSEPNAVSRSGVRIVDELITADTVPAVKSPALSHRSPATPRRVAPPPRPRRSLFARIVFGTGEHRPSPFPHPPGS